MSCCCTNTLDFCKQPVCDSVDFDILAQVAGNHTMKTDYLGMEITVNASFDVGDKIIFPLTDLNEGYQFTAELFDPVGTKILISKEGVNYDCFKFQTVINKVLNPVEESGS